MSRRGSGVRVAPVDVKVAALTGLLSLITLVSFAVASAVVPGSGPENASPPPLVWVLGTVTVIAQCIALLWRRVAPRAVLLITALAVSFCAVWGLGEASTAAQFAVLVAAYTLGLGPLSAAWPTVAGASLLIGMAGAITAWQGGEPWGLAALLGLSQGIGSVGLALAVAVVVTTRREIRDTRARTAAALEREQRALVQATLARERTAMARELHDIAAHHLSGIAVMSAAIATQIDTDPEGAKVGIAQVRQQSRAVLKDLRSLVGLLRDDDGQPPGERVRPESFAGITALVEDATDAGRTVSLTVLDGPRPLGDGVGPLAQLAAYRMAQESLANAARHAPGSRAQVTLDNRSDAVVVTVRNGPPPQAHTPEEGSGFGLLGMRERAELTGATLAAGPTADDGWQVRLQIPREPLQELLPADPAGLGVRTGLTPTEDS